MLCVFPARKSPSCISHQAAPYFLSVLLCSHRSYVNLPEPEFLSFLEHFLSPQISSSLLQFLSSGCSSNRTPCVLVPTSHLCPACLLISNLNVGHSHPGFCPGVRPLFVPWSVLGARMDFCHRGHCSVVSGGTVCLGRWEVALGVVKS